MAFEVIFQPTAGGQENVAAQHRTLLAIYLAKGAFWASFVPSGPDFHVYSLHNVTGSGWEECQLIQSYFCEGEYSLDEKDQPVIAQEAIFARPHSVINTADEFKPIVITHTDASETERDMHIRHIPDLPAEPLVTEASKMPFEPWTYN